jgi:phospholipase/lecithinase/hemolysin
MSPASAATNYTALYSFGDSLSDVGNRYAAVGIPLSPYYNGRYSDGPNWLDDLSPKLGLGVVSAALTGGNDFAVGGAQTGPTPLANTDPLGIDLTDQVTTFTKLSLVKPPVKGALYTLDIGAIDIGAALTAPGADPPAVIKKAVLNTVLSVAQLYTDGARDLLYYQVPDLALVPAFEQGNSLPPDLRPSALAQEFNIGVLDGLKSKLPGLTVFDMPIYDDMQEIVAHPNLFGFANVTTACLTGGPTNPGTECTNPGPSQYLFWDHEHPTAAADAILARVAFDVLNGGNGLLVPEPATWALMLAGFAFVGYAGYRGFVRRSPPRSDFRSKIELEAAR